MTEVLLQHSSAGWARDRAGTKPQNVLVSGEDSSCLGAQGSLHVRVRVPFPLPRELAFPEPAFDL